MSKSEKLAQINRVILFIKYFQTYCRFSGFLQMIAYVYCKKIFAISITKINLLYRHCLFSLSANTIHSVQTTFPIPGVCWYIMNEPAVHLQSYMRDTANSYRHVRLDSIDKQFIHIYAALSRCWHWNRSCTVLTPYDSTDHRFCLQRDTFG